MEAYIIIICATITAISVAYKIAENIKSANITPFVIVDGLSGFSYPVGVPNEISKTSKATNKEAVKVHLNLKHVKYVDFETIKIIYSFIKWQEIINKIVKKDETEIDYSNLVDQKLLNEVVFDCIIDFPNPIITEITFNTNSKIIIKWK